MPEIPSAAEMAEEGLEIKVMNIRLLQKIEELTLHLISQDKQLDIQKEEATQLKEIAAELLSKLQAQEQEMQALKEEVANLKKTK